jgi:hypothetical protein
MKIIRLLVLTVMWCPLLAWAQQSGASGLHPQPSVPKIKPAKQVTAKRPSAKKKPLPVQNTPVAGSAVSATPSPTPEPGTFTTHAPQPDVEEGTVALPVPATVFVAGDVQSGNVLLNVNENGNKVVKIGLAPRGVAVIDFPADDPVYKIYPGDENFVTVDCLARQDGKCANAPTDAIVLRPGKSFHDLGTEESAATVVTIQRRSGLVVSLIVVPVKSITANANYVVVRYELQKVLEARQKAGLAVNLQSGTTVLSLTASSSKPGGPGPQPSPEQTPVPTPSDELSRQVVAALKNAATRTALRFAKPIQGIALAPAVVGERTGDITIDVVAVRNVLAQAIRLVPGQPELVVESRDKRESGVNIQRLTILHTATTVESDEVLQPGQVYFFAFAYTSPILGVKQVLRASFSHRLAADAPAILDLETVAR